VTGAGVNVIVSVATEVAVYVQSRNSVNVSVRYSEIVWVDV
jgi:hypothetical protein